jgi:hypothetical protein
MKQLLVGVLALFCIGCSQSESTTIFKKEDLCDSKRILDWIVPVIIEEAGIKGVTAYYRAKAFDIYRPTILNSEMSKPFGPGSKTAIIFFDPRNLGVHVKTGAVKCVIEVNIQSPVENPDTGLTYYEPLRWAIGESEDKYDIYRITYRIVPKDKKGRMLALALFYYPSHYDTTEELLPSAEDLESLIANTESGKSKVDHKYRSGNTYRTSLTLKRRDDSELVLDAIYGVVP